MPADSSREQLASSLGADAGHVVMERGFSLGVVGTFGHVRLVQFRLTRQGFSADRAADDADFAAFLDEVVSEVDALLRERWRSGIALRAAFDGEGELIERLYETGPLERCDAVDPASTCQRLTRPDEQVDARELLVRASARLVENWGVFAAAPRVDGAFAHGARLRQLVASRQ